MKRRSNWIKCVVAVSLCLAAVSCTKEGSSTPSQVFVDNFKALVMGGREIDSHQDWNTVGNAPVRVSVDLGNSSDYTVYISESPLIFDADAVYIGMVRLKSGESKTINIPRPANTALLYAACYDGDGHAMGKPFAIAEGTSEVSFTGKCPTEPVSYTSTTGNAWSVPVLTMPDLSAYTTGTLVDPLDTSVDLNDNDEVHFQVSTDFTGFIPSLTTFSKKSAYVTATWTLTFNQHVANGNVIVVGPGGKIVIPKDFSLTSAPLTSDRQCGRIYVLPGGEISGDGTVEFSTDDGTYCYNAGIITTKTVRVYGGTIYNEGTIGTTTPIQSVLNFVGEEAESTGHLINAGAANLAEITGYSIAIENAGYLKVNGELHLNSTSKMDDGSLTECSYLSLIGSSDGDKVLHMGNAAYLNCLGEISIDNFGIWGPSGDAFKSDAIVKVNSCGSCKTTDGVAGTYLLDHVELILPETFPTILNSGALNTWDGDRRGLGIGTLKDTYIGYNSLRMIYYWLNGYEGRLLNGDNYRWTLVDDHYSFVWNGATTSSVDASRQTCTYSTSPSYDYSGVTTFSKRATGSEPSYSNIFYLFETLDAETKDFDYNDVVLRVNIPTDNGDGTYTSNIQVMCVGNRVKTTVLRDGEPFGEEVHAAIGTSVSRPVNTTEVNRIFRKLGEITFSGTDFRIDRLNFTLSLEDDEGKVTVEQQPTSAGSAPLYIVVNGNTAGKWFWPIEGSNIGLTYPRFTDWAASAQAAIDWYDKSNAASGKTVSY